MEIAFFMILFGAVAGASVWGLAQLASEERWLLLGLCFFVPPLAPVIVWREGSRPGNPFYLIDGIIIAVSLFLPLFATWLIFIIAVANETYLLHKNARKKERDQKNQDRNDNDNPGSG